MASNLNGILNNIARSNIQSAFEGGGIGNQAGLLARGNSLVLSTESLVNKAASTDLDSTQRPPKDDLRTLVGKEGRYPETIGPHPDFAHLEPGESEEHYIVSVFVDMQGSTILGTRYPLEQVRLVKNGLIISAIDIFQAFDGHIHRLQGDAIFAFFGRKGMAEADAAIDALNACMVLQNFCNSVLSPLLSEKWNLDPLRIRIGIDYGDNDQVLWSHFGVRDCDEITTTSVHTDLAAKMQAKARANHTMIGDNVRQLLDLPDEFYTVLRRQRNGEEVEDRYALDVRGFRYSMWNFEWEKYLSRFILVERPSGTFTYQCPKHFQIRCLHKRPEDSQFVNEYRPNCGALPIGLLLRFELVLPAWLKWDEIEWRVRNRGQQASEAPDSLEFPMKAYKNRKYCYQSTAYVGHHYMRCTIKHQNRVVAQEHFGVYVRCAPEGKRPLLSHAS